MTKKTLFIADLHLSDDRSDISDLFYHFLRTTAREAQALYILGDLFEIWFGDDNHSALNQQVAFEIKQLSDSGVPVYFIHGNRDFIVGKNFAAKAGMILLPEHHVIQLYGQPVLIMHGDTLCTLDVAYQKFRIKSRKAWWQKMMLSLPLFLRRTMAQRARQKSELKNSGRSMTIMDVTQSEVERQMRNFGVNTLIHGHTHRPDQHYFTLDNQDAKRVVLGDWYTQGSVLEVSEQGFNLIFKPFDSAK
ncbi:MAG: UDP-2,3-diacylglucosamine diphosphatase [Gammaproteobacteria bacterium]|nr:UDP-2,3-diacylglucosamine diphosphatase [Gammaproteobacteria bacterium]